MEHLVSNELNYYYSFRLYIVFCTVTKLWFHPVGPERLAFFRFSVGLVWFSTFGYGLLTEWSLRISCACLNLLQHQKWKLLKETGELMSTSISGIICWLGMTSISISVVGRGAKGCAVAMEMMVWSLGLCWSPEALGAVDNACWWRRTMQIQL